MCYLNLDTIRTYPDKTLRGESLEMAIIIVIGHTETKFLQNITLSQKKKYIYAADTSEIILFQSINVLFKVQSHHQNGLRTLLDNDIWTIIKSNPNNYSSSSMYFYFYNTSMYSVQCYAGLYTANWKWIFITNLINYCVASLFSIFSAEPVISIISIMDVYRTAA